MAGRLHTSRTSTFPQDAAPATAPCPLSNSARRPPYHGGMKPVPLLLTLAPGTRVVVRYRIEGGFTDALGELVEAVPAGCVVRTRRGEVSIPMEQVVAAKQVPPPPARRPARQPD